MRRPASLLALVPVLLAADLASAQEYPIMERVAEKVIQKYQTSSCQDPARQKSQPPMAGVALTALRQ